MKPDDEDRGESVSALERGFAVLRCFTPQLALLSHQEIVRATGLAKATVTRIVQTLVKLGYLESTYPDGRFRLTASVMTFGHAYLSHVDVRSIARPLMAELAAKTQATVNLATASGTTLVVVETCKSPDAVIAMKVQVGFQFPLASTAIGRAYLAGLPEPERKRILQALAFEDKAERAAVFKRVDDAVDECAQSGFTIMRGEWRSGINAVAVPIVASEGGAYYALNCAGPGLDLPHVSLEKEVGPQLVQIAKAIEKSMGRVPD